jgi:hypothetical protein
MAVDDGRVKMEEREMNGVAGELAGDQLGNGKCFLPVGLLEPDPVAGKEMDAVDIDIAVETIPAVAERLDLRSMKRLLGKVVQQYEERSLMEDHTP